MNNELQFFVRELGFSFGSLQIYQSYIGDVGHVVWDAAIVLAKFIDTGYFTTEFQLKNKNVLELGSGTGLVGLVAAIKGSGK